MLDEDEETGIKKYRYIRTGTNHFSMAFTYAWLAMQGSPSWRGMKSYMCWMKKNRGPWIA